MHSNCVVYPYAWTSTNSPWVSTSPRFDVGNLTIHDGGSFNANGLGYGRGLVQHAPGSVGRLSCDGAGIQSSDLLTTWAPFWHKGTLHSIRVAPAGVSGREKADGSGNVALSNE